MNAAAAPVVGDGKKTFRFIQTVVSPRARGLSVRLNLNPDGRCNFDCVYCDVQRSHLRREPTMPDLGLMIGELEEALDLIRAGLGARLVGCAGTPAEYLRLGHVALSGNGEPTLCPIFEDVVETLVHLRAQGRHGFFKVAIITNGTGLLQSQVKRGLRMLTNQDEIWTKLDAGSEAWYRHVNRTEVPFDQVLENILTTARSRPVILQSLFPRIQGRAIPLAEQDAFAARVEDLRRRGARIPLVQVYSATRPAAGGRCGHAALPELSSIARRIREITGIPASVF